MSEIEATTPGGEDEGVPRQPERDPESGPRIYVASLSDYNAGRLLGIWLDAAVDDDDLAEGVQTMLAASPEPIAEEFAIHDYEGFGPIRLSEFEPLTSVARIARGISERGPAFAHWVSIVGDADTEALDRFEDAFRGHFDDLTDYAESLIDDFGWRRELEEIIPAILEPYVRLDTESFARDLELSGDVTVCPAEDGGVYVFEGNI